jgi:hypothetical protein
MLWGMFTWRRVGGTPATVVASMVFTAAGAVASLGLVYVLITGEGEVISWSGVILAELFLICWTAFAFRLGRVGVFISTTGVRNRSMWRTQTLAWQDIRRFETQQASKGSSTTRMLRVHAVWILLKNGSELRTSLMYRDSAALRPASGLARFMGNIAGERASLIVSERRCQRALRDLRAAHETAGGG